jgi:hypothetical protein
MELTMKSRQRFANKLVAVVAALAALAMVITVQAQTQQGKAEVRAITGRAAYSTGGAPFMDLKVGTVLYSGTTIKTAPASSVDLFLGNSAGVVRVTESTTLAMDKLTLTDTGADIVTETQLDLREGTILGNVNKLSLASRYEIRTPNGVAGIRGTRYQISASSFIILLEGTMVYVHVQNNVPQAHVLRGPPAVMFAPNEGVRPAPQDIVNDIKLRLPQVEAKGEAGVFPVAIPPTFVNPRTLTQTTP